METRSDVKKGWDKWAAERRAMANADTSFWCPAVEIATCLALRDDINCKACYEADTGEKENP